MNVGGFTEFSLIDYPGKICSIVFCQGCHLRCGYCHNKHLQCFQSANLLDFSGILEFLKKRRNLLEAVVFSGGEPLLQKGLNEAISNVRMLGFMIGLHTSGYDPKKLENLLPLLDWVGFDLKTSFKNYNKVINIDIDPRIFLESFLVLKRSNIPFEIRTTYDPENIMDQDLIDIAIFLSENGIYSWVIQQCIIRRESNDIVHPLPSESCLSYIRQYVEVSVRYGY